MILREAMAFDHGLAGGRPLDLLAPRERIAGLYERFAEVKASGRSPLHAQITHAVADDDWVLEFLAQMPEVKWQPNLLLGAVRYLFGTAISRHRCRKEMWRWRGAPGLTCIRST